MRWSIYPDHYELCLVENDPVFSKLCWFKGWCSKLFLVVSPWIVWFGDYECHILDVCWLLIILICSILCFGKFGHEWFVDDEHRHCYEPCTVASPKFFFQKCCSAFGCGHTVFCMKFTVPFAWDHSQRATSLDNPHRFINSPTYLPYCHSAPFILINLNHFCNIISFCYTNLKN